MSEPTLSDPVFISVLKWTVLAIATPALATYGHIKVKKLMNGNGNGSPHPARRKEDIWVEMLLKMQTDSTAAQVRSAEAMEGMKAQLQINGSAIKESAEIQAETYRKTLDRIVEAARCNYKDKPRHERSHPETH